MSGIETASLVLALLPVLVNQLDNYVQGLQTIKSFRTRRYRAEFEGYLTKLATQKAILLNTLEQALEGVVENEEELSELINDPKGSMWSDPHFQEKLCQTLGRNYEPFAKAMAELAGLLEQLSNKLGLDPSSPRVKWSEATTIEKEIRKFKDIVSKSVYTSLLRNIDDANRALKTLVDQLHHCKEHQKGRRLSKRPLLKHKTSRKLANSLYNAIILGTCWKCPCKDQHYVYFRLDMNITRFDASESHSGPQTFRLAFSSKSAHEPSWCWKEVETEPVTVQPSLQPATSLPSASRTKQKVRFTDVEPAPPDRFPWLEASEGNPISNICSTLSSVKSAQERRELIGFIADEVDCNHKHNLYLVSNLPKDLETRSLEDLLQSSSPIKSQPHRGPLLNRRNRLYLAAILACSVLQFHGTWLKCRWRTRDILFPKNEAGSKALLDRPYLSAHMLDKPAETKPSRQLLRTHSALIRNEILFPLGIALVELSLCQSILALRAPEDDDPVETVGNLKTACRHIQDVYYESGTTYGGVVEKCLFWHGSPDANLDNEDFQATVFDTIVTPLLDDLGVFEGGSQAHLSALQGINS